MERQPERAKNHQEAIKRSSVYAIILKGLFRGMTAELWEAHHPNEALRIVNRLARNRLFNLKLIVMVEALL